jgi:hypothetical protein
MIGKWIIIVAMGLLLFGYAEAQGEDWKLIRKSKDGDSYYYDAANIARPSQNIVRGSVKIVYSEKSKNREISRLGSSYKDLNYRINLWEMNCSEKKVAFLQITTYTKNGAVINSIKVDSVTWASIVPDTMGEDLYKSLCK